MITNVRHWLLSLAFVVKLCIHSGPCGVGGREAGSTAQHWWSWAGSGGGGVRRLQAPALATVHRAIVRPSKAVRGSVGVSEGSTLSFARRWLIIPPWMRVIPPLECDLSHGAPPPLWKRSWTICYSWGRMRRRWRRMEHRQAVLWMQGFSDDPVS